MGRLREYLRFWMTFESPVNRGAYLRHGAALGVTKYAVDASAIYFATGILWSPWSYLGSVPGAIAATFHVAPRYLAPLLAAWTLPFLWIGVTMTMRRLLDAGRSAWWALLFFVPVVGYLLMAALSIAPSSEDERPAGPATAAGRRLPTALLSIAAGTALGLALIYLGIGVFHSYGLSLFLGIPFAIGLTTGLTLCRAYPASALETAEVVVFTVLLTGGSAFLLGVEGAICLLLFFPLGVIIALLGGAAGRWLAMTGARPGPGAALGVLLLPTALFLETDSEGPALREVESAVVIAAPPSVVWDHVVQFDPLPPPTEWMFRLGVAYPLRAEIEGQGVGAVRYCVFSTGAFVEPITAWEPGRRLAFDVAESPPPLRELTPYDIDPPHLEGYLMPRRGEFRLVALPDGTTRLEGSTWYEQRLRPEGYWVVFSDRIISRIHERVLGQIKREAEAAVG